MHERSTPLLIREMQIKTKMSHSCTVGEKIKERAVHGGAGVAVQEKEPLHMVGENAN